MAQIVPGVPNLGEILGTGLGQGIQQLANMQLEKMLKQRQQQSAFQALQGLGYNPQQAAQLSQFEPDILKSIATQKAKASARSSTAAPGLRTIIPGLSEQESAQIGELTPGLQLEYYRNYLKSLGVPEAQQDTIIEQSIGAPAQQALPTEQPTVQQAQPIKAPEEVQQPKIAEKKPLTKTEQIEQARIKKQQALEKKEAEKTQRIEQKEIDKETKPYYDETIKGLKSSQESEKRLDRIENIIDKGYLGGPIRNAFVRTFTEGIFGSHGPKLDLTFLMTADAQELNKLTKDFVVGAKDFFPGRVTDADLRAFLERIPSLSMTKEGMRRASNSLRSANKAAKLRAETMESIIEENGGKRPKHLDLLVEKRIGKELDKLYKDFINAPLPGEEFGAGVYKY